MPWNSSWNEYRRHYCLYAFRACAWDIGAGRAFTAAEQSTLITDEPRATIPATEYLPHRKMRLPRASCASTRGYRARRQRRGRDKPPCCDEAADLPPVLRNALSEILDRAARLRQTRRSP
jgi:hypothetical protein